tara:strand:+ start:173 stop:1804 length:1632 start_codon:yes stop_codon:yes gene_type:complete
MARLETNLEIKAGNDKDYLCTMTEQYDEVVTTKQIVDNSNTFKSIATFGLAASIAGDAGARLSGSKLVVIKNNSPVGVELQFQTTDWKDNSNVDATNSIDISGDGASTRRDFSYLLGGNEFMVLPSQWLVSYENSHSAANAKTIDNKAGYDINSGKLYSAAITDIATALENDTTTFVVDDTDFFKVGDLIQLGSTTGTTATNIEIAKVTSITNTTTMELERGLYGSTTADKDAQTDATNGAVVNAKVYFPWFNTQENYDKYHDDANALGIAQTNGSGRYTSNNLFGYGRTSDDVASGIVKGSFAMKFYNSGYQELGLSGITPSTHSGLTASVTYYLKVAADGGTAYEIAFTTDSQNLNFGGNNGIIQKIQAILDQQFYAEGNLYEKGVTVSIVNGDIRFTSHNRTRNSAIAITAGTTGGSNTTNLFDGTNPIARIPASPEKAIPAKLPDDTLTDKVYNTTKSNKNVFAYDDGKGNILGQATGTINYETGALDFTGPPNAEFAVSFNYDSAHSGGITESNILRTVSARSCNSKIDAEIEILGYV